MANVIRFLMTNFTLTFLLIGLIGAAICLLRRRGPLTSAQIVEDMLAYFILFPIGAAHFYNFISHVFWGDMAAK